MKIERTGLLPRFYMWSYGKTETDLPKDFCSYFWALSLAILLLPITIISCIYQYTPLGGEKGEFIRVTSEWSIIGRFVAGIITAFLLFGLFAIGKMAIFATGSFLILVSVVSLAVFVIYLSKKKSETLSKVLGEASEMTSAKVKSIKEKHCALIEWE